MTRVFWKKGLKDLGQNPGRSVLVVLAIALGIFGISMVATSYSQLMRDIVPNYMRTNPASATIQTQALTPEVIEAVENLPSVAMAEARQRVVGRVQTGPDTWKMIWLFIVEDFDNLKISTFFPEEGAWPLAWMEGFAYGYVTQDTLSLLGAEVETTQVYIDYESFIRFHDYPEVTDEIQVRVPGRMISTGFTLHGIQFGSTKREVPLLELDNTAANLEREFENAGIDVYASWKVAEMKKSADDHMKVASLYVSLMTFLILLVGGLGLIITMGINVLERTREIGVLRSIGASNRQLYRIIIGEGLVIGGITWALSLVLAVPAGWYIGNMFGRIFFETSLDFAYPIQGPFFWLLTSLIFSAAASFFPAKRAARISVRNALAYE